MDHGSAAAKVVVGLLGGLYLIAGLGLTAFAAFAVLSSGDTGGVSAAKTVLYTSAALAIWVLLTGIGAIVVGLEADEKSTAWLGGLGVLALGVVIVGAYAVWFFTKP
ncbi:hypothetical protein Q5425_19680 [Amycolatopsis sp. A133]|uniref:hypothetical protein n=1 Tax=Amycolatopsis sp. A133 TaxID=3064472 RepID=UPI0027F9062C|nr:hypothetical protein [Amycolatopsis sp. A133]MDQ7805967.1 hypothetical protein [Amycolatopsis sp. A133]